MQPPPTPDFDLSINRRSNPECAKWNFFPPDVLPMWVADMDFAVAPPIIAALQTRLGQPALGYAMPPPALRRAIVDALLRQHGWKVEPEALAFLSGLESGLNIPLKAFLQPGDSCVVQTPMYKPILAAPGHWGMKRIDVPFTLEAAGYGIDPGPLDDAIARARAITLCNPHNPTGKVYTREELTVIAASCERHNVLIISDEIHCDLAYSGHTHIPIASLSPEIEARTVTLMSAGKTFNIAGLKTAFAIIPNAELREKFQATKLGLVDSLNIMGIEATRAAYESCEGWRQSVVAYLEANRDYLALEIRRRFPKIRMRLPQASFLAWLDCTGLNLEPDPQKFFLEKAKVGFNPGADYGELGRGFVRMNFGCPRALITEALDRMERVLTG